jgi:hypothetical protein
MIRYRALLVSLVLAQPGQAALKAQYKWGYLGPEGQGHGTMSVLVAEPSEQVVIELQGMGERIMLLSGDRTSGYRLQIPRQGVDLQRPDLAALPMPLLPEVENAKGLENLLRQGTTPGVSVTNRDSEGPIKLHYSGKNGKGEEVEVWLTRTRWEKKPPVDNNPSPPSDQSMQAAGRH